PPITNTVVIDGYSQAQAPVQFSYPTAFSSAIQGIAFNGFPIGGTFQLTADASILINPFKSTTDPIPLGATPAAVKTQLESLVGAGNVAVAGTPTGNYFVTFQSKLAHEAIPDLIPTSQLIGGSNPSVAVSTLVAGGVAIAPPALIQSTPNTAS